MNHEDMLLYVLHPPVCPGRMYSPIRSEHRRDASPPPTTRPGTCGHKYISHKPWQWTCSNLTRFKDKLHLTITT